ncbi:hypothetical protein [Oryzibacter oryziterrae]|uniref:hypothetical protein n=1 Tax=Oryzibacter oryziterrae TaxID=2766474 RepID=UPI001F2C6648|nr:hypothetical protein [Oryzibacter oryziterrae]
MKLLRLLLALSTSVPLVGCNQSNIQIEKFVAGVGPSGGVFVEAQSADNFVLDGKSQVGALYYVRNFSEKTKANPESIDLACAVVDGYGSFTPQTAKYPSLKYSQTFEPGAAIPSIFKSFFGGVSAEGNFNRAVKVDISNVAEIKLNIDGQVVLQNIFKRSKSCKNILSALPSTSRSSVFQLVSVVFADVKIDKKISGSVSVGAAGIKPSIKKRQ